MKKIIILTLFWALITPFLPRMSLAYLTPTVDGTYHYQEDCYYWISWSCNDSWSIIQNEIIVEYSYWEGWDPRPYSNLDIKEGILEFDISSLGSLFTRGQMKAVLSLTVQNGDLPANKCLRLYNIQDGNENGIIEGVDVDSIGFIGEICENLQPGNTVSFDVTS